MPADSGVFPDQGTKMTGEDREKSSKSNRIEVTAISLDLDSPAFLTA